MQESLVKVLVFFTALLSIVMGAVLMLFPGSFAEFTGITTADVGWLRNVGAATLGIQGFGLMIAAFRRRDTNLLVGLVGFVTTLEAGTLWYSLFTGEYGEMSRWVTIAFSILATVAAVILWFAWVSRRKSLGGLPQKKVKAGAGGGLAESGRAQVPDQSSADSSEPPADLVEEIDSQSPRFRE